MRTCLTLLIASLIALTSVAQEEADTYRYGVVTPGSVKAMAGPNAYDAEVASLTRGDVVRVVRKNGDWLSVIVPGGVEAYVKGELNGRTYLKLLDSGEGMVVVDRLQLRPRPNTDWPAMGVLAPMTQLVILGQEEDDWYRVMAPERHTVSVPAEYVDIPTVQDGLAAKFDAAAKTRRAKTLESAPLVRRTLETKRQQDELQDRFDALERRLDAALSGGAGTTELRDIRLKFENLANFAPAGSDLSHQAREKAVYIRERESVAGEMDRAEERIRALERRLEENETKYSSDLTRYRETRRTITETTTESGGAAPAASPKAGGKFLRYGIGRVHKDLVASTTGVDLFVLSKGSEPRYRLISHRYDLAEYYGKRIGISRWKELADDGGREPRIEVLRLEIIE